MELVLNGDIFDFAVVLACPEPTEARELGIQVGWLERRRGLRPEERKSLWKMRRILDAHRPLLSALSAFIARGNRLVFIIGNHDLELHWDSVQQMLIEALAVPGWAEDAVRICAWFYRSNDDTLITHGNQLDPYCLAHDPLHPFIDIRGKRQVRMPFGDLAGKYLSNGIGWFNPHVPSTFVKSVGEWIVFFYRVVARQQPLLLWTWFWTAVAVLLVSVQNGFRPAAKDPLTFEDRLDHLATQANASPGMALALQSLHAHPAVFRPWKMMRELWLDRAFLILAIGAGSFQLIASLHLLAGVRPGWIALPLVLLLVPFVFYARSVDSDVAEVEALIRARTPTLAALSRTQRVVMGHTHNGMRRWLDGVEYLNTGHWAPGFHDLECTERHGLRGFVWVRPEEDGERVAQLRAWDDPDSSLVEGSGEAREAGPRPLDGLRRRLRPDAAR